jgi:hypothetical protein
LIAMGGRNARGTEVVEEEEEEGSDEGARR